MIFDHTAGKGIKKKWIPQPNPRKVEMARRSSLQDVLKKAKDIYFYDHCDYSSLRLADTNGIMIEVETSGWMLETYYENNDFKPSRHKMYVMQYDDEQVRVHVHTLHL